MVDLSKISLTKNILEVDKSTLYGDGVNAAYYGITITRSGSIQFGQLLAEEIGIGKESDINSIDISLSIDEDTKEGQVLIIIVSKDKGSITNTKRKKKHFASKRHMKQLIEKSGTEEVKERWTAMFDSDATTDLKSIGYGKSYRFSTEDTKETYGDGLYKAEDNIFLIDLMAGSANNTGEDN